MCVTVLQWKCSLAISKWRKWKLGQRFLRFFNVFFDMTLQKNVKSRVFWIFKKKRKNVFSNYVPEARRAPSKKAQSSIVRSNRQRRQFRRPGRYRINIYNSIKICSTNYQLALWKADNDEQNVGRYTLRAYVGLTEWRMLSTLHCQFFVSFRR